jgi:hypothetical protein
MEKNEEAVGPDKDITRQEHRTKTCHFWGLPLAWSWDGHGRVLLRVIGAFDKKHNCVERKNR